MIFMENISSKKDVIYTMGQKNDRIDARRDERGAFRLKRGFVLRRFGDWPLLKGYGEGVNSPWHPLLFP
jgi:hypothetical protein